jgi:DNA-binding CsgD family transcriptional regulator
MSGDPRAAAVVFVTDPDAAPPRTARLLGDLYGLTPAESRLAFALLEGADLSATAVGLGVSRNTAQSQLASIFRKTGTSRQSELVQLIARGAAAVRSVEDSSGFWPAVVEGEAGTPPGP